MRQEFTDIPWGIGKEIRPQEEGKFNPFTPVRIIYPQPSILADLLRSPNQQRQYRFEEEGPDSEAERVEPSPAKDFVRVVVDEKGHVHWRYNSYIKEGEKRVKRLRHFGGKVGSDDLQKPLDQIDRILDRIMGFEVKVDTRDRQIATPKLTFSTMSLGLTAAKEQVRIPGEIDWVAQCLELTNGVLREMAEERDLETVRGSNKILVRLQDKLERRRVPSLELAAVNLEQFLESPDILEAVNAIIRTGGNFLTRSRELTYMTRGLMRRRMAVSGFLNREQIAITSAHEVLSNAIRDWEEGLESERLRVLIERLQRNAIVRDLGGVVTEPYKSRAQKVLKILDTGNALEVEDYEKIADRWRLAMEELQAGQRHIKAGQSSPTL